MANSNGWGDGSVNNNIGWGQGANNSTGWGKSHLESWSGATDIDGGNLPSNSVAPAITGTAQEGQTLTCSTGTWNGSPTYSYQWKRNGSNIGGATNSTYLLVTADVGQSIKCTVTATNFVGSATADSNTVTPTSSTDADAQAFITAASITDHTQQSAINQLVVDLKGYSIWTKMKAIYPFVGGTAATHKWNLKDPRDLDAAFRLVFNGGWTHSATGATPNGTNAYADTKLNTSTVLGANSAHLGYYSRTNSAVANELSMGNLEISTGADGLNLVIRRTSDVASFRATDASTNGIVNTTVTDSRGLFVGAITSATSRKFYKNSSSLNTLATNYTWVRGNSQIFIGAACDNTSKAAFSYTNKETAFNCIGDGLTDTEVSNLYTAVQTFNTTLNRNV